MDCDDDGETHAGSRLAHLLDIIDAPNHLVVVRYAHILGIDAPPHTNTFLGTRIISAFSANMQYRFAPVVLGGVLGPPHPARHT